MAQVKDILGKVYKGNENTGEVYSFPSKDAGFFVEQTAKERKMSALPYVKLKAHYKRIDEQVRANEAKAYASGYDVYDFEHNKDKGSFEFANTSHGIDLIFKPKEKKKTA